MTTLQLKQRHLRGRSPTHNPLNSGFTTIEVLVVIVMIGILGAIAGPSWLSFVNSQRVKNTADAALQTMRRAQSRASTENRAWEASFRMNEEQGVQGSAHPVDGNPAWTTLSPEAGSLVTLNTDQTTLSQDCDHGDYCVSFEDRGVVSVDSVGNPNDNSGTLARIAFVARDGAEDGPSRCIVVATILGSLRVDNCE